MWGPPKCGEPGTHVPKTCPKSATAFNICLPWNSEDLSMNVFYLYFLQSTFLRDEKVAKSHYGTLRIWCIHYSLHYC